MTSHQHVLVETYTVNLNALFQRIQKPPAIGIIPEQLAISILPRPYQSICYVVDRPFVMHSELPRHS